MRILVTHSGRQHSHQLARALHEGGTLAGYWTGVPATDPAEKGLFYRLMAQVSPQPALDLPENVVRHNYVAPVVRRVVKVSRSSPRAVAWTHRANAWFDRWCARRLPKDLDAVVAYENSALDTFRAAKAQGITTVLDAASFHHQWQDKVYEPVESGAVHAAINARKDRETALADHVLTVSDLARKSYVEGGVPPERVTSVPMGADLSAFRPPDAPRRPEKDSLVFLFAGHVGRRKGADLLLKASRRLFREGIQHEVRYAGDYDSSFFEEAPPTVEPLGYLGTDALVRAFRGGDVLVLPSRHDSFGRTVVEGMATGLPALVSEHVGAKEAITEGENGWVVPAEDADALMEHMRWCVKHPERVAEMQSAAVRAAQGYTWTAYRERVTSVFGDVIRGPKSAATDRKRRQAVGQVTSPTVEDRDTPSSGGDRSAFTPEVSRSLRSRGRSRARLSIFATHPIQYQVPWFRALDDRPEIDLTVYYDRIPDAEEQGEGFGKAFTWDLPLLNGYDWRVYDEWAEPKHRVEALHDTVSPTWTDVVLVTGWHDSYLLKAAILAKSQGVPVLVRGDSNALRPRPPWIRAGHRMLMALYDKFLFVGKANRAFYRQYGVAEEDLYFCPHFVENERFDRQYEALRSSRGALREEFGVPEGAPCVLFVGKFVEKKHPEHVLDALEMCASSEPVHGLMVGAGPLGGRLREEAQARDVPVTFTGFLNQTEVAEAYATADVLVLPSDYGETWGLVVNEAMIFECPAIVSDRVGCGPDLVDDGETGYTFPFGDVDALADRIREITEHPGCRRTMGRRARERVLSEYTVEKGVEATVEAARSVAERSV